MRWYGKSLICLFLFSLIVRLFFSHYIYPDEPVFSKYLVIGQAIREHGLIGFSEVFEYSPLYSLYNALAGWIFGSATALYLLVIQIIGSCNSLVIAGITRKLFGKAEALTAGLLYALGSPFILADTDLITAGIVVLWNGLTLYFLLNALQNGQRRHFVLAGLFCGLSAVTRANILLFALLVAAFLLYKRRLKHLVLFLLVCIVPVWAVTTLNYIKCGDWVLIQDSGRAVLFSANNFRSTGLGYAPPGVLHTLEAQEPSFQHYPATMYLYKKIARALTDQPLSVNGCERFWLQETKKQVLAQPAVFAGLALRRLWYALHGFCDYDTIDLLLRGRRLAAWPVAPTGLLIAISLLGLFVQRPRDATVVLLHIAAYMAFFLVFYITERFRVPMVFAMLPFGARWLVWTWRQIRTRNLLRVASGIAALALVLLLLYTPDEGIVFRKQVAKPKFLHLYRVQQHFGKEWQKTYRHLVALFQLDPVYGPAAYFAQKGAAECPDPLTKQLFSRLAAAAPTFYQALVRQMTERLKTDPSDLEALRFVAADYVNLPADNAAFPLAAPLIERLLQLTPADPSIHFLHSLYLYKRGALAPARAAMEEAIRLGILYSSFYRQSALFAAQLFWQQGNKQQAQQVLHLMKNLFPNDRESQRLISRFSKNDAPAAPHTGNNNAQQP